MILNIKENLQLPTNDSTDVTSLPVLNSIHKISLFQFRNYASASFDFTGPVTCIAGLNGSGKTNLLDAVYYLCYTKSYFTSFQQNCVQAGMDGFRVTGEFTRDGRKEVISAKWRGGKKEITANGTEYEKITDHIGRYSAVMIAPDDTELVNGSSELRRKWMDGILSQADKVYFEKLILYQRVLLQRNAWLKAQAFRATDNAELDFYDAQISHHAGGCRGVAQPGGTGEPGGRNDL